MIKRIVHTFWQSTIQTDGKSFVNHVTNRKWDKAQWLVSLFYFLVFFISLLAFTTESPLPSDKILLESESLFIPIWSSKWIYWFSWKPTISIILFFFFISSMLSALFWKRHWIIRLLTFLGLFIYLSLISSFGKIDHYLHSMLIASFLFIFIPNREVLKQDAGKRSMLQLIFGVQCFILCMYFVSGIFKLYGVLVQVFSEADSAFSVGAMSQHVAGNHFGSPYSTHLMETVVGSNSYFWNLFLLAGFVLELACIYFLFKPKWQKIIGFALILLHISILFTIGANFVFQILMLAVFFLFTPFARDDNWFQLNCLRPAWRAAVKKGTEMQLGLEEPEPEDLAETGGGKVCLIEEGKNLWFHGMEAYLIKQAKEGKRKKTLEYLYWLFPLPMKLIFGNK